MGGLVDGAVEVEFLGGAGAREPAQAPQRDSHVAHAELDAVVEVLELALVPHLHGAEIAGCRPGRCGCLPGCSHRPRRATPAVPIHLLPPSCRPSLLETFLQGLEQLVLPMASICCFSSAR